MAHKILLLPGDGIGPEVMAEAEKTLRALGEIGIASFETERDLVGGCAYEAHKVAITEATMQRAPARRCHPVRRGGRTEMG